MHKHLLQRWTPAHVEAGVALIRGATGDGPFGRTEKGLVDLRGMPVAGFLRPDGAQLCGFDFSGMRGDTLIFANSVLEECDFGNSHLRWGDSASSFRRVSFAGAKLGGSGLGGDGSTYTVCSFAKADLSGSIGHKPSFIECCFERTRFKNTVFSSCSFTSCTFAGKIEGVIFATIGEGLMRECDFRAASFVNCTFNRMRFESCRFSSETILFVNWAAAVEEFERRTERIDSPELLSACRTWGGVWKDTLHLSEHSVVDLADLKKQEGPVVGAQMFGMFERIKERLR